MNFFTPRELAAATGGIWRNPPPENRPTGEFFTDSRNPVAGGVFIALSGDRFDGHRFLGSVAEAGAAAAIVRRDAAEQYRETTLPLLIVDDTLNAYQRIAEAWRMRFPELTVIAVTGSVGKTSTKEMLRAICAAHYGADSVLATEGNTNNQIGVPRNLLRLTPAIRAAVIEMGTSAFGEIAPLSRMAHPRVAAVNAVAACHLEKLVDLDGVAREKSAVYDFCTESAVFPADCPQRAILEAAADRGHLQKKTFGESGNADIHCTYEGGELSGSRFTLHSDDGDFPVRWALCGRHQTRNAACAAACGRALGIPGATVARGLAATKLPGMRMKITSVNGVVYANDAYNANPESMKACLENFAEFADPDKLILVLGDMLELGGAEESGHRDVLTLAEQLFNGHARILAVGSRMTRAAATLGEAPNLTAVADAAEAGRQLRSLTRSGDLILLKASRGTGLEAALPEEAKS